MSKKNTGGPAFPRAPFDENECTGDGAEGMSLRDYFAAKNMNFQLIKEVPPYDAYNYKNAAVRAYKYADAMLKAREE